MFPCRVHITFVDRNGEHITVPADVDDNLLDIAKDYDIDGVEGKSDNLGTSFGSWA